MRLLKIVMIFSCVCCCAQAYSQTKLSNRLNKTIKTLKFDVTSIDFIPVDSIISDEEKLKKEFKIKNVFFGTKNYYLFKIGYYIKDSVRTKKTKIIFEKLKKEIKNLKN